MGIFCEKEIMVNMVKKFYQDNKAIIWIILLGLISRTIIFFITKPWSPAVLEQKILLDQSDGYFYHHIALDFLRTLSFDSIGIFRTPLYPLFLAFIYFLFGVKPWVVIIFQFLLNVCSIGLVYVLGKKIFNKQTGIIASALYLIEPYSVFYSSSLLSDGLFTFVFLLSMLLLVYAFENNKIIYLCFSALLLGIATLIRPISQYFPVFIILFILFFKNFKLSMRIKSIIVYTLIFLAVLAPWLYRNYSKTNVITLSSLTGGNLLFFNAAITEAHKKGIPWDEVRAQFSDASLKRGADFSENASIVVQMKNSLIFKQMAKEYLLSNFKYYLKEHMTGCARFFLHSANRDFPKTMKEFWRDNFSPPRTTDNFFRQAYIAFVISIYFYLFVTYMLFVFGAILMFKEKRIFYLLFVLGIMFYFVNMCGPLGHARYKLSIVPFYTIISAYALSKINKIKNYFVA
jgi:4-amino-4-deoxy-L-arabinose transferase-like glycosyltransferase